MSKAVDANRMASWRAALGVIIAAGIAGGVVDAIYFSTMSLLNGRSPIAVLQGIASFWRGAATRNGGVASAAIGLATHFGLATVMAGGYFVIAKMISPFRRRPLAFGTVYGILLYGVMYFIVLPQRWPALYPRFDGARSFLDIGAHVGVGIAIAGVVSTALSSRSTKAMR